MSIVQESQLIDRITVEDLVQRDGYGKPIGGTQVPDVKCRIEAITKSITDFEGREVTAKHWIVSFVDIKVTTQVWLPGEDITQPGHLPALAKRAEVLRGGQQWTEAFLK